MTEEQNINQLPKDWKWVKLGDIAKIKGGKRLPKGEQYSEQKTQYPYLRVVDFENMTINKTGLKFLNENTQKQIKNYTISSDDLYISIAGTIGRVGMIPQSLNGANLTENAAKITEIKEFDLKYLSFVLNGLKIQQQIAEKTIATTQPKLALYRIEKLNLALPPKLTQQAIVSKIEELFSELDKGIEQLKTAQQQLKTYRQSVLKAAFEGRLSSPSPLGEGRGEVAFEGRLKSLNHDSYDLHDEHDLTIAAEHEVDYKTKNNQGNQNNHINHSSDKSALPEGWKWSKIGDIAKIETGTTPSKSNPDFYGTDFPFYKPTDLEAGANVVKSTDGLTKLGVDAARYIPGNSTLVTCIGATIGKTGFIKIGGGFNQQINAIVPNERMNPKFIYYQTIGLHFQKQILDNASATTLPIINKGKFQILEMVVCSIEEQNNIVQEIESRLSVADKMEESITQSLQQAEALRQSILKKAFEGRLV